MNVSIENNEIINNTRSGIRISNFNVGNLLLNDNTILNNGTESISINLTGYNPSNSINISNSIKKSIEINLTNYIPGTEIGGIESNTFDGDVNISGTFQRDFVLAKRTYTISNDLTIPEGINLVIEAGTILNEKIASNSLILVEGSLQARGTSNSPIIFTDNSDSLVGKSNQFYWEGIKVGKNGQFTLEYGEIRYAGTNGIYNMGSLEITNSKIINTQKDAIKLYCDQKDIRIENNKLTASGRLGVDFYKVKGGNLVFKNNEIQDCGEQSISVYLSNFKPDTLTGGFEFNTLDDIKIYGSLLQDFELYKNTYVISGNLTIPKGTKLTIDAGSIVKVEAITSLAITVEGELNSNGTLKEPVVFTGVGDTQYGGDKITYWSGFVVTSKGTLKLNYTNMRYPGLGKSSRTVGTAITCQGTLEMNNSAIVNSKGNGIIFSTLIQPILKNNSFINNVNYSVKNSRPTQIAIDGTNNYWGSGAGPALYDKTTKTWSTDGGKISEGVNYNPFLIEDTTAGGSEVNADITYLNSTEPSKNVTARVTVKGGDIGTTRNYYAEVYCSWDEVKWYKRAETEVDIPVGNTSASVDLDYIIYQSGELHSKVVVYEGKDGNQISESKISDNNINVWYYLSINDSTGVRIDSYISAVDYSSDDAYLISKRSDESVWVEYRLNGSDWVKTGKTYATNPIENNNMSVANNKNSLQNDIVMNGSKDKINDAIKEVIKALDINENKIIGFASECGFEYDPQNDAYVSKKYCWQKNVGYQVTGFDTGAQISGMCIDCEPVYFSYKQKNYLIEFWKGQYFVSTGCEIGVYENKEIHGHKSIWYDAVEDENDMLNMKYILKQGNNMLITREDKTWWLTSFKPGVFSDSKNLSMDITIDFPDSDMLNSFKEGLIHTGYPKNNLTVIDNNTIHSINFTFAKPYSDQPKGSVTAKKIWSPAYSNLCVVYNDVKDKHGITDNSPESYATIINEILNSIQI